jgi:FkbM family methyltransferase
MLLYKIYLLLFPNDLIKLIAKILKKKKHNKLNILDIGCYIGNFSKVLNDELISLKCKKLFHLIDPNFNIIDKINLINFNFKFKFYNLAIHNNNKKKTFYLNNFFQSSGSSLNKTTVNDALWNFSRKIFSLNLFKKNYSKIIVQCQTLDNFAKKNNINKIDILKFDTEGNELNILKGAKKTLKNTSIIYFEILSSKSFFSKKFNNVHNILLKNNFFLYKKKKIVTVSFLSNLIAFDLIYIKKGDYSTIIDY